MKKGLFVVSFLFISISIVASQSIPSFWMNIHGLNDLYRSKTSEIKQITAFVTGYYSSGETYKEKWVYNYVDSTKIVGQSFKNGQLRSSFEYELNCSGRLSRKLISSKQPMVGWRTMIYQYEYEDENLIFERHLNKDMTLIDYVRFEYNSINYPIKMTLFDNSNQAISYETADYDLLKMAYKYKIFDANGRLISETLEYCGNDKADYRYNQNGDIVQLSSSRSNPAKNIRHSLKYKYDERNNWTKRKWFIQDEGKKKKRSIITRKNKYSSTN